MKKILFLIIPLLTSCTAEYELYKRDKSLNYPSENLKVQMLSDSTGVFKINELNQEFTFLKEGNYILVKDVSPLLETISLKPGDTLISEGKKLHFFYKGKDNYLLSFKKRRN